MRSVDEMVMCKTVTSDYQGFGRRRPRKGEKLVNPIAQAGRLVSNGGQFWQCVGTVADKLNLFDTRTTRASAQSYSIPERWKQELDDS